MEERIQKKINIKSKISKLNDKLMNANIYLDLSREINEMVEYCSLDLGRFHNFNPLLGNIPEYK